MNKRFRRSLWSLAGLVAAVAQAQTAIPAGQGSYAEFPPEHEGAEVTRMWRDRPIFLTPQAAGRPVPTNDWWTNLLADRFAGELWAYPLTVKADAAGLEVFQPVAWSADGTRMELGQPLQIGAEGFAPADARAADWSDWLVAFELAETPARAMRVTLGQGLPFAWIETRGLSPDLELPPGSRLLGRNGRPAPAAMTGDRIAIEAGDRRFGVYAPEGTRFAADGNRLRIRFPREPGFLAVAALPEGADLEALAPWAWNCPRQTRVSWSYRPEAARLEVTWRLETEDLRTGQPGGPLPQGFLPHHWRRTLHAPDFAPWTWPTPRGRMRCAVGSEFRFAYRFAGIPPHLPPPEVVPGAPNPYDPARMARLLAGAATRTSYGKDTYWGGKDLLYMAQYLHMCRSTGHPGAADLQAGLARALEDWFTYTPGETEHYFARYPRWGALVGFDHSYNSFEFVDNHFHYGYFTLSAAMLAMADAEFAAAFGPMARLVARQYADGAASSPDFPRLRTFNPWRGHSYAGGLGSPGGNNQESSSEAMQAWAGIFLLGGVLGDQALRDTGAFGYLSESRATAEYWFDRTGENLPPAYGKPVVGILFDGGNAFATYFSGEPAWIHGIQWLPISPALNYLVEDYAFAAKDFESMMQRSGNPEIAAWGSALGNVVLGYLQLFDPDRAAALFDRYWATDEKIVHDNYTSGLTYYFTHANRALGPRCPDRFLDLPHGAVHHDAARGLTTCVVYNPDAEARPCRLFDEAGTTLAGFTVPARSLIAHRPAGVAAGIRVEPPPRVVAMGAPWQALALAVDAHGATVPGTIRWRIAAGEGTITADGLYQAPGVACEQVVLEAAMGDFREQAMFRVGDLPRPTILRIVPPTLTVPVGGSRDVAVEALDQYGHAFPVPESLRWQASGGGSVGHDGRFRAGNRLGQQALTATLDGLTATAEVTVRPPSVELSRGRPASASSEQGANRAALAFDDDPATRWESEFSDPQWLAVDLGRPVDLERLEILWETARAKHCTIEVSDDGRAWRPVRELTDSPAGLESVTLAARARHLRIMGRTRATEWGYSIFTLRVFGWDAQP